MFWSWSLGILLLDIDRKYPNPFSSLAVIAVQPTANKSGEEGYAAVLDKPRETILY
jgi:hypothetical protein